MLYFKTLPKIISPDENGNIILLTNILTRAKLLEELQNNPMLFYQYTIQDGDTPEIVADKYYGDSYRYWIILYSNQILDPLWNWPLNYNEFLAYLESKYAEVAQSNNQTVFDYLQSTIKDYQKIVTTKDSQTDLITVNTYSISQSDYVSLSPSTNSYTFSDGKSCTVDISKNIQYLYDYEVQVNDAKREIKLMDSFYALQMEQQLYKVMNQ